jgi:hypothetical protein
VTRDLRVPALLLAFVAAFMLVITVVYAVFADERAGTVMLLLSGGLAGLSASYLWWQDRRAGPADSAVDVTGRGDAAAEHYLPHTSVWPLGIGVAAFLMANGLILGVLFLVPGAVLLVLSIAGFCRQSRYRA